MPAGCDFTHFRSSISAAKGIKGLERTPGRAVPASVSWPWQCCRNVWNFAHTAEGRVKRKHKGSHLQAGGRGLGRSLSRPAGETKPASTSTVNFWPPELKTAAGGRRAQQGVRGNLTTQEGQANLHSLPASRPHSRRPALEVTSATWLNETSLMAGPPAATVWPLPVDMPASGSFGIRRDAPRCQVTGPQTEGLARTPQWPVSQLRPLWASVWEPVGNTFLGIAHGQEP